MHSDDNGKYDQNSINARISDDREVPQDHEIEGKATYIDGVVARNMCAPKDRSFYGGFWRLRVIPGHRNSCCHRRLNPTGVGGLSHISLAKAIGG